MSNIEVLVFIGAAALAGGLSMGGVTLVYFLDKWRADSPESSGVARHGDRHVSPFEQAA